MDRFSRLQALTGDENVVSAEMNSNDGWGHESSAVTVDSNEQREDGMAEVELDLPLHMKLEHLKVEGDFFTEYQDFELGQLAPDGEEFCPLNAVRKYPYNYIGVGNRQRVAETFFDKNQLMNDNTWDLFYVHQNSQGFSEAIILLPTEQFRHFLATINQNLGTQLTISDGSNGGFEVAFYNHGTPHPRFLGRSTSHEMAERMKTNVPPSSFKRAGEKALPKPDNKSLEAFRQKIELLQATQKGKNKAKAERRKAERIQDKAEWGNSLKRVQRYLGLRETRTPLQVAFMRSKDKNGSLDNSQLKPTSFAADKLAPFVFESDVVFICVDVEAYEKANNKITEIGISTLDTRDIAQLEPGKGGKEWMKAIRSRHFRISDYKHLINKEFVDGCPDRFDFGKSEFISLKDAERVVASCFKHPFSKAGVSPAGDLPMRNIILVGHDVMQDVQYLRKIGYEVYNLSNLVEQVDTAAMYRYMTRDQNPRSLGVILADLGIAGWNLHNAGNDAAFTLQAMIGVAIKAITEKQKGREILEAEKLLRVAEKTAEAKAAALDIEAEWDSDENADGGNPVKPIAIPEAGAANTLGAQATIKSWTPPVKSRGSSSRHNQQHYEDPMASNGSKNWNRSYKGDMDAESGWTTPLPAMQYGDQGFVNPQNAENFPALNTSNPVPFRSHKNQRGPGRQGYNNSRQRWGGLEQSFVSAGTDGKHNRSSNSNKNTAEENDNSRGHVDEW